MSAHLDKEWKNILISGYVMMEAGEKYGGKHLDSTIFF